jgi:hypothetical protein
VIYIVSFVVRRPILLFSAFASKKDLKKTEEKQQDKENRKEVKTEDKQKNEVEMEGWKQNDIWSSSPYAYGPAKEGSKRKALASLLASMSLTLFRRRRRRTTSRGTTKPRTLGTIGFVTCTSLCVRDCACVVCAICNLVF